MAHRYVSDLSEDGMESVDLKINATKRFMVVRDADTGRTLGIESVDRIAAEIGLDVSDDEEPASASAVGRGRTDGGGAAGGGPVGGSSRVLPPGWLDAYPSFRKPHSPARPLPIVTEDDDDGSGGGGHAGHAMGPGSPLRGPMPMYASRQLNAGGRFMSQRKLDVLATTIEAAEQEATPGEARRKIKEMVIYLLFVTLFSFIVVADRNDQQIFFFSKAIESLTEQPVIVSPPDAHKTFAGIESAGDMYAFLETTLYPMLYEAGSFDGDATFPQNAAGSANAPGTIWGVSNIVGAVRIGQLRVRPQPCADVPPELVSSPPPTCYPKYSEEVESTASFGRGQQFNATRAAAGESSEAAFTSITGVTYPEPAFAVLLPNAEDEAGSVLATIRSLATRKFVDLQTRAVFIDASFHNFMLDRQVSLRLVVEFPESGGAIPSHDVIALRLFQYYRGSDYVRAGMEIVLMLMVFRFLALEVPVIRRLRFTYFASAGRLVHTSNLLMFIVVWAIRLATFAAQPSHVDLHSTAYVDMRSPMAMARFSQDLNSINAFFTWLKLFGYLSFMSQFSLLTTTLNRAAAQLTGFAMVFAMVMFAASQAFMLCFGANLFEYRNMTSSFLALIRALLGDFSFEDLRRTNRFLGPILFVVFVVLAVFVLLNMFIAIISESYDETKDELQELEDMNIDTLGKEIWDVFTKDFLFKVPGARWLVGHAEEGARKARHRLSVVAGGDKRLVALAKVHGQFSPKIDATQVEAFPLDESKRGAAAGGGAAGAATGDGKGGRGGEGIAVDVSGSSDDREKGAKKPAPAKKKRRGSKAGMEGDEDRAAADAALQARLSAVEARQESMVAKLEAIHDLLLLRSSSPK